MGGYGNNILLFFIGAISGTLAILLLSMTLEFLNGKYLYILSSGSLVILEFHGYIIRILNHLNKLLTDSSIFILILTLFNSVMIIFLFIPIIQFVKKYIPTLAGIDNNNNSQ